MGALVSAQWNLALVDRPSDSEETASVWIYFVIPWELLPGSTVVFRFNAFLKVEGELTLRVKTNPTKFNYYESDTPNNSTTVIELVQAATAGMLVSSESEPLPKPTDRLLVVTLQTTPMGGSSSSLYGAVVEVESDEDGEVVLLTESQGVINDGAVEFVGCQWLVDFDKLKGTKLQVAVGGNNQSGEQPGQALRVRIGGTDAVADGDVFLTFSLTNETYQDPLTFVGPADQVKPTGKQLVKLTAVAGRFGQVGLMLRVT